MTTKTASKKTTPAKATKVPAKAVAPKVEFPICKPQARILSALAKAKGPLNSATLAEKSGVPQTHITGFTLVKYATKRTASLVEQSLAKAKELDVEGRKERVYEITPAGRKMLDRWVAAGKPV